ncbi:DUF3006 domain-containing protein [Clostridium sp. YIM B02555]|uniref:DUF3006 domain-containing protein n=1 Tax=Clostridium sp. YIM B02555 TaxID=2911968 RepID=UPI001EEEC35C|nr:DUF3006 domain-containing protein [Clostridium sp. YIM B02555]
MSEKYIIDRVEGTFAIVENEAGEMQEISLKNIKGEFKEGDILVKVNEYFEIDVISTLKRKSQIKSDMEDMWRE